MKSSFPTRKTLKNVYIINDLYLWFMYILPLFSTDCQRPHVPTNSGVTGWNVMRKKFPSEQRNFFSNTISIRSYEYIYIYIYLYTELLRLSDGENIIYIDLLGKLFSNIMFFLSSKRIK
jgi:hypothetical protein